MIKLFTRKRNIGDLNVRLLKRTALKLTTAPPVPYFVSLDTDVCAPDKKENQLLNLPSIPSNPGHLSKM